MIERLVLGSAKWGWSIEQRTVFALLDDFVHAGGQYIDAATNYPINGCREDWGLANRILCDWLRSNPGVSLGIFVKLGSVNNSGKSENNLTPSYLKTQLSDLQFMFGGSLKGVGVHWDNRGEEEEEQIAETIAFLRLCYEKGLRVGFSGIKSKNIYLNVDRDLSNQWEIQVKESSNNSEIRETYLEFFPDARYFAYGVGKLTPLKKHNLDKSRQFRSSDIPKEIPENFYLTSVSKLIEQNIVKKIIIGPRTTHQLGEVLQLFSNHPQSV